MNPLTVNLTVCTMIERVNKHVKYDIHDFFYEEKKQSHKASRFSRYRHAGWLFSRVKPRRAAPLDSGHILLYVPFVVQKQTQSVARILSDAPIHNKSCKESLNVP